MAIAKTTTTTSSNANRISNDVINQISDITSFQNTSAVTNQNVAAAASVGSKIKASDSSEKEDKSEYSDNINLRLPKGERKRLKSFCAEHDISMTQFIVFAIDYLESRVEDGVSSVSKMGVKEIR